MDTSGLPITFDAVAKRATVSHSWLYAQPDLRAESERPRTAHRRTSGAQLPDRQRAGDPSLPSRLKAANIRIRLLKAENQRLRDQFARALGEHRAALRTGVPDRSASP
jgi:Family of unknown function (DUF6262)